MFRIRVDALTEGQHDNTKATFEKLLSLSDPETNRKTSIVFRVADPISLDYTSNITPSAVLH